MKNKKQAAFGTWPSPIDSNRVAHGAPRIAESCIHQNNVYWLESIAKEKGRITIMRSTADTRESILPQPFNVRSKVHEYGGGCFCFDGSSVYFINASDQEVYVQSIEGEAAPKQITKDTAYRYADIIYDSHRKQLIAVAERHTPSSPVENLLVTIALTGEVSTLHSGYDFYAYPRLNETGKNLCWISWNHPNMPWDNTSLHIAKVEDVGIIGLIACIGEDKAQSIVQPSWAENGDLYFVSDHNNWWNIYRIKSSDIRLNQGTAPLPIPTEAITNLKAEFATPLWVFRMQNYAFIDTNTIVAAYTQNGYSYLCSINIHSKLLTLCESNTTSKYASIESIASHNGKICFIASTSTHFPAVFSGTFNHNQYKQISHLDSFNKNELSAPQALTFPTTHGDEAYAFFYPPLNSQYTSSKKPPLIVLCHGGPTGQTNCALNFKIQYWTNRGFAVIDVNYRGSTGYGRRYRQVLYKQWGIYDVEDMVAAVNYLVNNNTIDENKVIIKGSSAGGYTVLAALAFTQTFNAGVSLYGIGDLELLATDTHKFEAHYLDQLIGPYPQEKEEYQKRSPIHSIENFNCPLLIYQGLEDNVVPPNQAKAMAKCVKEKGLPVALVEYKNEGHGFRLPETIEHMLNAELYFYQRIFALTSTFEYAPISIDNLTNK